MSDHLPSALKARALHAAHAVTLGALMLTGCPNNTTVDDDPDEGWDLRGGDSAKDISTDVVSDTLPDIQADTVQDQPHDQVDQQGDEVHDLAADQSLDLSSDTGVDLSSDTGVDVASDTGVDQGEVVCNIQVIDNICGPKCTPNQDADCCIADPACDYYEESKSCGCVVPGPFRAPEMPV